MASPSPETSSGWRRCGRHRPDEGSPRPRSPAPITLTRSAANPWSNACRMTSNAWSRFRQAPSPSGSPPCHFTSGSKNSVTASKSPARTAPKSPARYLDVAFPHPSAIFSESPERNCELVTPSLPFAVSGGTLASPIIVAHLQGFHGLLPISNLPPRRTDGLPAICGDCCRVSPLRESEWRIGKAHSGGGIRTCDGCGRPCAPPALGPSSTVEPTADFIEGRIAGSDSLDHRHIDVGVRRL